MSENANSLELITNLNKVIQKRGLCKTIEILKKGQQPEKHLEQSLTQLITRTVCREFKLTEKELFFGKTRKHNRRWALSFFCYFVNLHLKYSQSDISKSISRTNACVSKYIKDVYTLTPTVSYEARLLEQRNKVDAEIKLKLIHILRYGKEN